MVRTDGRDSLRTMTLETRLDSEWTDQISTLVGLFYSNEATRANVTDTISLVHPVLGPISIVRNTVAKNVADTYAAFGTMFWKPNSDRSEEHTSELQSLMRISYAVFCLKKKKKNKH